MVGLWTGRPKRATSVYYINMKIKEIKKKVIDKIQLFLDLNNGKNKLQKQLGWGPYVYYRYLHSEEYCEEMATFDNKEDAETFLHSCEKFSITFVLADAHTFVRSIPVEMALDLFEQFFYSRVIPGYYEEH